MLLSIPPDPRNVLKNYRPRINREQKLFRLAIRPAGMSKAMANQYLRREIHCGIHSNIPDCCILFFINFWTPILRRAQAAELRQYYDDLAGMDIGFDYIPCPACRLKGKPVKLKRCRC